MALASLVIPATSVVICPRTPLLSIESARSQSDNVIIDGSYNPDAITKKHSWKRQPLLVLLLCLCKHFKELSKRPRHIFDLSGRRPAALGKACVNTVLHSLARFFSAKADAKVHIFCEPAKYYATFFHQQRRFSKKRTNNEKRKTSLPYYIYTKERFVLFRTCFNHRLPVPYDTVLPQGSYVDKRC